MQRLPDKFLRVPRFRVVAVFGICLSAIAAVIWLGVLLQGKTRIQDRVYVIGWQHVPPFQQKTENNLPGGLAVDLIRNAARRRGIRLQWKEYPGSSEAALRNHEVDLWPLITITPERQRQKAIHISEPWLQHDHNLVVLRRSKYSRVQDVSAASIAYLDLPINRRLLDQVMPGARLVPVPSTVEAVENLCAGRADAVFLDEFSSGNLSVRGISCSNEPLRVIPLTALRSRLGVGSTPEAAAVADELRRSIDVSFVEGDLGRILMNEGYYSTRNLEYFTALVDAQLRERWLLAALGLFAGMLAFIGFEAHRIRRQRNRILQTSEALRRSEEKLRLMVNNLSEVVLAYDMDRRLIFASPAVERLTGYSAAELAGNSLCWVHPNDRLRIRCKWDRLFLGSSYNNEEYRLITKSGTARSMVATWGPLLDESGEQIGIQGAERDVTERKTAELALLESERRFRELLERVQLVALITDDKGAITFCNDYTLSLTGWNRDEIIGRSADSLVSSDASKQDPGGGDPGGSSGRTAAHSEGTILEKSGGRRCIRWSSAPLRTPDGRIAGFARVGEDITDLRNLRLRIAQQDSDERFRNTADTAPLMIWQAAPDMSCTFVNRGWLVFTGRTLEQELGTGWTADVHPDDLTRVLAAYRSAFEARRQFQVEFRKRRADGEYRWVLCNGVTRFGMDGGFAGYVGSCADITDLKRTRDADTARQRLETLSRLTAGVAHDFNNVLGGVLSQADLALQEFADGQDAREQLERIRNLAVRGAETVRQLMVYAGYDCGNWETVDISRSVEAMLDGLRAATARRAALTAELLPGLPCVRVNLSQLRDVVRNLVANALDAIGSQYGTITLRTYCRTAEPDEEARSSNGHVVLEVSDSGCGITSEHQPKIFEPFFTTSSSGRGLGLAVAYAIVQGLGGGIECESEPGRGACFRIFLPCVPASEAPPLPPVLPEATNGAAVILVIEDEDSIRLAAVKTLRRSGLSVIEAPDGTTALSLLRQHGQAIRAILLDITIPGATSREVFDEARRLNEQVKVIVASAYSAQKADECFPGMRIDGFLGKPYRLPELSALLHNVLGATARG